MLLMSKHNNSYEHGLGLEQEGYVQVAPLSAHALAFSMQRCLK